MLDSYPDMRISQEQTNIKIAEQAVIVVLSPEQALVLGPVALERIRSVPLSPPNLTDGNPLRQQSETQSSRD